jgi:hypothetical protein
MLRLLEVTQKLVSSMRPLLRRLRGVRPSRGRLAC